MEKGDGMEFERDSASDTDQANPKPFQSVRLHQCKSVMSTTSSKQAVMRSQIFQKYDGQVNEVKNKLNELSNS